MWRHWVTGRYRQPWLTEVLIIDSTRTNAIPGQRDTEINGSVQNLIEKKFNSTIEKKRYISLTEMRWMTRTDQEENLIKERHNQYVILNILMIYFSVLLLFDKSHVYVCKVLTFPARACTEETSTLQLSISSFHNLAMAHHHQNPHQVIITKGILI